MNTDTLPHSGIKAKLAYLPGAVMVAVVVLAANAWAVADPDAVALATSTGTSFKETTLGVLTAIVPLAVAVIVAKRAFRMAKGWIG